MTKSQIFKAAWAIAKNAAIKFGGFAKQYFAIALSLAYKNGLSLADKLLAAGATIWEKGSLRRIYINEAVFNAVFPVIFDGYPCYAPSKKDKLFLDLNSDKLFSDSGSVRVMFNAVTHSTKLTCGKA